MKAKKIKAFISENILKMYFADEINSFCENKKYISMKKRKTSRKRKIVRL